MMNLVPFDTQANLPAFATEGDILGINKEVVSAAAFPVLSIKGMKFTAVDNGVRTVITKPDDPDEVAQSLGVVVLRANMHAKTFYAKKYAEGDSDGARPDCYSYDGVAPSANAQTPQSKKCAVCPHNQWGARVSESGEAKGKACQDNARLAITAPDTMRPMLLRVPPASLKALKESLKIIASRKVPYNGVVLKVGFDREAPSPKLTFKPVGLMDDAGYSQVKALYDDEVVRAIVGLDDLAHEPVEAKPALVEADELDAALAARAAAKAPAKPQAKAPAAAPADDLMGDLDEVLAAPKEAKADKPKRPPAKPKADEVEEEGDEAVEVVAPTPAARKSPASDLLDDLDSLLGSTDD